MTPEQQIKAIETRHGGCKFRSRLEARWALFFDTMGWEWQYEPVGFEVNTGGRVQRYLPDFYLPAFRQWVEVKGSNVSLDKDLPKMVAALEAGLQITPEDDRTHSILVLGPIPRLETMCEIWLHAFLFVEKGIDLWGRFYFREEGINTLLSEEADELLLYLVDPPYHDAVEASQISTRRCWPKVIAAYAKARAYRFFEGGAA